MSRINTKPRGRRAMRLVAIFMLLQTLLSPVIASAFAPDPSVNASSRTQDGSGATPDAPPEPLPTVEIPAPTVIPPTIAVPTDIPATLAPEPSPTEVPITPPAKSTPTPSPSPTSTPTEEPSFLAAAIPAAVTVSPSSREVDPGEAVTYTVTISGTVVRQGGQAEPNGIVYVEASWPFADGVTSSSIPSGCTVAYDDIDGQDYYYDLTCQADESGNFTYQYSVTGNAPEDPGVYDITIGMYRNTYNGRPILSSQPRASLNVVGDTRGNVTITTDTPTVDAGDAVTYTVTVSVTMPDAGSFYVETYWPFRERFVADIDQISDSCVEEYNTGSGNLWGYDILCTTDAGGDFTYTYTVSGLAPNGPGNYDIYAKIYEPDYGANVIYANPSTAILTVNDPEEGGESIDDASLTILPETNTVTPDQQIDYRVIIEGTVAGGAGVPTQLELDLPFEHLGLPWCNTTNGSIGCDLVSSDWNDETNRLTVLINVVSGNNGNIGLTLFFTVSPPAASGTYPISASLARDNGTIPLASAAASITVNGLPPADPVQVSISPDTLNVAPGEEATYTASFSGTVTQNGNRLPFERVYLATIWPFPSGVTNQSIPEGCDVADNSSAGNTGWWFDVVCDSDENGDFNFTFTVTGLAPINAGSYDINSTLYQQRYNGFYMATPPPVELTVTDPDAGNVQASITTDTTSVEPASSVTYDITLSGVLAEPGTIYLFSNLPLSAINATTLDSISEWCTQKAQGSDGRFSQTLGVSCTTQPDGTFNYTFSVTGPAPVLSGTYNASATLYKPYFGDSLLFNSDPALTLTVLGTPDVVNVSLETDTPYVHPGDPITYNVTVSGTLTTSRSYTVALILPFSSRTTQNPDPIVSPCSKTYDHFYSGPFWEVDVTCQTDAEGNFNYSFSVSGIAPDYPSDYGVYYHFYRGDGIELATERSFLHVLADGEYPDGISLSIFPPAPTVSPGGWIAYAFHGRGDMNDGADIPLTLVLTMPFENFDTTFPSPYLACETANAGVDCTITSNTWDPSTGMRTIVFDFPSGVGGVVNFDIPALIFAPTEPGTYDLTATLYRDGQTNIVAKTTDTITVLDTSTPTPTNTPVPTPTNTPTPTPTNTPTPTPTNTPTPTPTNTPSPTPTNTAVPTATNTAVPTPTNTAVPTATNTAVPTATNTAVPTATNTAVPTATNTAVPTATNTAVPTATNTAVPTATNTAVPTATNTAVPTATIAPTETVAPTATAMQTATMEPTNTAAPTATPVPTNTVIPTATLVPTNTAVPTATLVPTNTAAPTETAASTSTVVPTATLVPTIANTAVPTAINTAEPTATQTTVPATTTAETTVEPTSTVEPTVTTTAVPSVTNTPPDATVAVTPTTASEETGTAVLIISSEDGGDIPAGTIVCIADQCQIVGETASLQVVIAGLPSGTALTFSDLPIGLQPLTITHAAPYDDVHDAVTIVADTTIDHPVILRVSHQATVSPSATTPGEPTSIASQTPGQVTPTPQATPGPGIAGLPNTGSGTTGGSNLSVWLLMLATALASVTFLLIAQKGRRSKG